MDESKIIESDELQMETSGILEKTAIGIAEGITGIAASGKKDWLLSVGHILQRLRAGQFLNTLRNEWEQFRATGRIKDDYQYVTAA